MKKKIYILIVLLAAGLAILVFVPLTSNAPTKTAPVVTAPVVVVPQSGDVTLGIGEKGNVGDLDIELRGPIQDSRCPSGVQCIWAGEVRTTVLLTNVSGSQIVELSSNKKSYTFDNHVVSMTAVVPILKVASQQLSQNDYKITFHVEVSNVTR